MELRIQDARYEQADRESIRALQLDKLKGLIQKAWATNPFYRERWTAAGVEPEQIDSLEDFTARVPMVEKQDFIDDQAADPPFGRRHTHALGLGKPLWVYTTSGTSGRGVEVHVQTAAEVDVSSALLAYLFRWAGLKAGEHIMLTMPVTMMAGGRAEYHAALAYGLTVHPVGNYDAAHKLELLRRFRPVALIGTTSYFGHLAAVSEALPPAPGLKCLLTGAEGSGLPWFERLEAGWRTRVFDRYGNTQTGTDHMHCCEVGIGERGRPGMLHNIDPYVLSEVIDPETGHQVADGEAGEIVLTSLYRTDTPLIRCRMGDRAVYHEPEYCGCGRPFAGVEVASIGRMDDMKKVKGVNIWPQAVDDVLFAIAEVDEYQVALTSSADEADMATVRIMPRQAIPGRRVRDFTEMVGARLGQRTGIRFEVELIPAGSLARSEYKARRWIDERVHQRQAGRRPARKAEGGPA